MRKPPHQPPRAPKTPASSKPVSRAEVELFIQKTRQLALKSPEKAAKVLTDWMNKSAQAPSSQPGKKKAA